MGSAIGGIVGAGPAAIAGAVSGGAGQQGPQQTQVSSVNANLSPFGTQAQGISQNSLSYLQGLYGNAQQYNAGGPAQYAQMLQQYSQNGGLPSQAQIGTAQQYAQNIFAPQQAALNNTFMQAGIDTNRQAAALGRPTNDPILQAKLAQYMGQQQQVLSGQQTAFGAQYAQQLPQQQLGLAQQLALNATGNQMAMFNLGNQALQNQQNYALATATRTNQGSSYQPGSFQGALSGFFGGLSGGMQAGSAIGGGFGGGGGGGGGGAFAGTQGDGGFGDMSDTMFA